MDALGNPTGFHLTAGQAHDLQDSNVLLEHTPAQAVIADKAYDAQMRVIEPLIDAGKQVVIPPGNTRKDQRCYDKHLYQARHLIENFFAKLKQYRAVATRYDKTARNFLGAIQAAKGTALRCKLALTFAGQRLDHIGHCWPCVLHARVSWLSRSGIRCGFQHEKHQTFLTPPNL